MALFIGIDCGKHTGLAVWDTASRRLTAVRTLPLYKALELVTELTKQRDVHLVFEDARKRRWLPREKLVSEYRGHLMGAGAVKRDSVIWEEFCKGKGIAYEAVAPRKGLTKWDAGIFGKVTGWTARTSKHGRDAAMLVFGRM